MLWSNDPGGEGTGMSTVPEPRQWTREEYERSADEYYRSLPLEHFMEGRKQAVQREISLAALSAVRDSRPDVHYFNEMLIQQFVRGQMIRVVPDLTVVRGDLAVQPVSSYEPELALPVFWALEFVSPSDQGEYTRKRQLYEQKLKIPYYLIYDPDAAPLEFCLYRHDGTSYEIVPKNERGRYPIPEIDLEIGMLDEWARFWFAGELLDRTEEAVRNLRRAKAQLRQKDEEAAAVLANLRALVESKARQVGRQDIIDVLPATNSSDTLLRWLAELG
jgi:Uma2 family endonuclease